MAGYSEVAPKNATHESNSFFNQCAETIIHEPKQERYTWM